MTNEKYIIQKNSLPACLRATPTVKLGTCNNHSCTIRKTCGFADKKIKRELVQAGVF